MMKLWMRIKKGVRQQWTGLIGAAGSVGAFIYNLFKPTNFQFSPQSAVDGGMSSVTISLSIVAVVIFAASVAWIVFKSKEARR